jgi:hypothetical protein
MNEIELEKMKLDVVEVRKTRTYKFRCCHKKGRLNTLYEGQASV